LRLAGEASTIGGMDTPRTLDARLSNLLRVKLERQVANVVLG
jgi:hypothetical protein